MSNAGSGPVSAFSVAKDTENVGHNAVQVVTVQSAATQGSIVIEKQPRGHKIHFEKAGEVIYIVGHYRIVAGSAAVNGYIITEQNLGSHGFEVYSLPIETVLPVVSIANESSLVIEALDSLLGPQLAELEDYGLPPRPTLTEREEEANNEEVLSHGQSYLILSEVLPTVPTLVIPNDWMSANQRIAEDLQKPPGGQDFHLPFTSALVYGSKGQGKSTLVRYLWNCAVQRGPAYILDCDLGQPEIGLPGCVNWYCGTDPLFGANYMRTGAGGPSKEKVQSFCVGFNNAGDQPAKFIEAVKAAVKSMRAHLNTASSSVSPPPRATVLINTQGWIKGLGWHLLSAVYTITEPRFCLSLEAGCGGGGASEPRALPEPADDYPKRFANHTQTSGKEQMTLNPCTSPPHCEAVSVSVIGRNSTMPSVSSSRRRRQVIIKSLLNHRILQVPIGRVMFGTALNLVSPAELLVGLQGNVVAVIAITKRPKFKTFRMPKTQAVLRTVEANPAVVPMEGYAVISSIGYDPEQRETFVKMLVPPGMEHLIQRTAMASSYAGGTKNRAELMLTVVDSQALLGKPIVENSDQVRGRNNGQDRDANNSVEKVYESSAYSIGLKGAASRSRRNNLMRKAHGI
eukprot:Clim_evm20s230 gene=Clim_evmTU20s230